MSKLKIAVYAISKNEEQFVERFMRSVEGADCVVIADTGSTDNTQLLAENWGAQVYDICITPWRFDKARDAALSLVPRDIDVCISLDLDEVLEPGWREKIEQAWTPGTTRLRYGFDWGQGIRFQYEKIHARHGYHWHHPCHEYPRADARITEIWAETPELLVSHHPDPTKSRGQYLDLLHLAVTEDPHCPRNAFYYARELTFYSRWSEAVQALQKYLNMPSATWANERCYAQRLLAQCFENLGEPSAAEYWMQQACETAPNTREPWCGLAMLAYKKGAWQACYAAATRALRIVDRELVYTCDPLVWGFQAHDLAAIAAWNLQLFPEALRYAKQALELEPNDPRLQANFKFITESKLC